MPEIPNCDRCRYYAHDYHLVCIPHPVDPTSYICLDFSLQPDLESKRFKDFLGLQWQTGKGTEDCEMPQQLV